MAPPQSAVQPLAIQRVLAEDNRLQRAHQGHGIELRASHGGAEKGVALDPLICGDRHEAELALTRRGRIVGTVLDRGEAVPREHGDGEVCDLHSVPPVHRSVGGRER